MAAWKVQRGIHTRICYSDLFRIPRWHVWMGGQLPPPRSDLHTSYSSPSHAEHWPRPCPSFAALKNGYKELTSSKTGSVQQQVFAVTVHFDRLVKLVSSPSLTATAAITALPCGCNGRGRISTNCLPSVRLPRSARLPTPCRSALPVNFLSTYSSGDNTEPIRNKYGPK